MLWLYDSITNSVIGSHHTDPGGLSATGRTCTICTCIVHNYSQDCLHTKHSKLRGADQIQRVIRMLEGVVTVILVAMGMSAEKANSALTVAVWMTPETELGLSVVGGQRETGVRGVRRERSIPELGISVGEVVGTEENGVVH